MLHAGDADWVDLSLVSFISWEKRGEDKICMSVHKNFLS